MTNNELFEMVGNAGDGECSSTGSSMLKNPSLSTAMATFFSSTSFRGGQLILLLLFIIFQMYLVYRFLFLEIKIMYQLKLWYEYLFLSIPTIHISIPSLPIDDEEHDNDNNTNETNHKKLKYCYSLVDNNNNDTKRNEQTKPVIQCFNPSTNRFLGTVPVMDTADIDNIIQKAVVAQKQWALTSYQERRIVLRTIQKYIVEHVRDISIMASCDSGKPVLDAILGEIITTTEKIRCLCEHGEEWIGSKEYRPVSPLLLHKIAYVEYVPLGVVATIAPWNYPFHNLMNHIVSGIFAGNAVVGKVSEYTSWSAIHYYDQIVKQALILNGHNPDLVATITGFGPAGNALCSHPLVDQIIFTGSPGIGKKVMNTASQFLKPVVLELGGKDAMVLMDECEIDAVVPWVLRGCYQNCGQNCVGVERVLVYEKIYQPFLDRIVPIVQSLRQGNPVQTTETKSSETASLTSNSSTTTQSEINDVDCGSMVTSSQIDLIQELIDDAVQNGARVLCGGQRKNTKYGQYYQPTVIVDVTPTMRIYQEEVFGPVMTICKVPNNDDNIAIDMINQSHFGLSSSVFCGTNQTRALKLGEQIRSGMCCINDFGSNYLVQSLPFGGVKESGFGRFGGIEGLRSLCLQRSILIDKFPKFIQTSIPKPINYPIQILHGIPFVESLVQLFYNESIIGKIKGIFGLIKHGG